MTRERSLERFAPRPHQVHDSLPDFEALPVVEPGVHTIAAGGATVDLLLDENSDSDTLLVFFPSAVAPEDTWPYFQGLSVAQLVDQPLLAISDPTIGRSDRHRTGWTLGDERYWLHREMTRYIDKVRNGRRLVFVGSSAGGFPALFYGSRYPDSISLVINPRTNLFMPPTHLQHVPARQFGDVPVSGIPDLVPVRPGAPRNTVVYLQNSGDHHYFSGHMIPYLHQVPPDSRVWTRMGHWGKGHQVPPKAFLHKVVGTIAGSASLEDAASSLRLVPFKDVDSVLLEHATINVSVHRAARENEARKAEARKAEAAAGDS